MNMQEITSVLSDLHRISGFRISLHDTEFNEIAAFPEEHLPFCAAVHRIESEHKMCLMCDRNACLQALEKHDTYIYRCRYGLIEAVSPLYNFGTLTGFLMMGQVCDSDNENEKTVAKFFETYKEVIETEEREDILPRVNSDTIDSYIKVMTICAKYLTLSNAIPPSKPTISELAKKYINDNIGKRIVIGDICDALKCSKSTLLTSFKRQYGITINTYITDLKLSIAQRMLSDGDKTINEIACELGFSDQSYFSKVFSTKYGIPPSEYRMGHKTQNTNYQGDN